MDKYMSKGKSDSDADRGDGARKAIAKPKTKDGSWSSYFARRSAKFLAQAPASKTKIFAGVVVYFNSCISASQLYLTRLVFENGGVVHQHWARKKVTHVVCDRLAVSKIAKELNAVGRSNAWHGHIVKPAWVIESVTHGRKLPVAAFAVLKDPHTRTLTSMQASKGAASPPASSPRE